MNSNRVVRHSLALIAALVVVCFAVIAVVELTSRQSHPVNGERLIRALAQYAKDLHSHGVALPPAVSLDTLLQSGYLTPQDVEPFEGAKVTFFLGATGTNPQGVLMEAHMPDGTVQLVLADGSVQQVAQDRWEEHRKRLGQTGSTANGSRLLSSETNTTSSTSLDGMR